MKTSELKEYLLSQGCSESSFAVGSRGAANDAYCLVYNGRDWVIFYTERGCDSPPVFSSSSEEVARDYFIKLILAQKHWHLVGFFINESAAISLAQKIEQLGVKAVRNDIPNYSKEGDARYRVFVIGKDILPIRKAMPNIPIMED
jgi:hypothetical protein